MKLFIIFLSLSLPLFAQEEESEAMRALRLSCQQNVGLGCYNYANMLIKRNQPENAEKYFEMGCKLDHSDSCSKKAWGDTSSASVAEPSPESAPSHAPASVNETVSESSELQPAEEASSEKVSPEETELDLSAIE